MQSPQRFDSVDSLRGLAMVWMTIFHFSFDLANAGYTQQNFYADPVWTWQRTCILSLFLLCAGAGQAIAVAQGQSWARFWRRWGQIAGCALLVSLGSWFMFPHSYIYFGVLHGMAVMLIVARLSAGWGRWLWLAGFLAIASKFIAAYAISTGAIPQFFNERSLNWLGWINRLPITEDYVPLFPWLGVVWWGMAATQWWLARGAVPQLGALNRVRVLAWLGRHSLPYYMLHQPVMLGLLALYAAGLRA